MAKRFTETSIWNEEWFMGLSPVKKCLVRYVFDNCDLVGVWSPNWKLASFHIGETVSEKDLFGIKNGLFVRLTDGKVFIPGFCSFQYGDLSENVAPHRRYLKMLRDYGLLDYAKKDYKKGIYTLEEEETDLEAAEDLDKAADKDKECQIKKNETETRVIEYFNQATSSKARMVESNFKPIRARLNEKFTEQELCDIVDYKLIEWSGTDQERHLTIETLFGNKAEKYRTQVQKAKDLGLTASQIKGKTKPNNGDIGKELAAHYGG